jgi:hypothetical protein
MHWTTPPFQRFFILSIIGYVPLALSLLTQSSTYSERAEVFAMIGAYFGIFSTLMLINAVGYWIVSKSNRLTNNSRNQAHFWIGLSAYLIFGIGSLVAEQIGSHKMGMFVLISLLFLLSSQVLFLVNVVKKQPSTRNEGGIN